MNDERNFGSLAPGTASGRVRECLPRRVKRPSTVAAFRSFRLKGRSDYLLARGRRRAETAAPHDESRQPMFAYERTRSPSSVSSSFCCASTAWGEARAIPVL